MRLNTQIHCFSLENSAFGVIVSQDYQKQLNDLCGISFFFSFFFTYNVEESACIVQPNMSSHKSALWKLIFNHMFSNLLIMSSLQLARVAAPAVMSEAEASPNPIKGSPLYPFQVGIREPLSGV